jgi:hypothetical protein
VKVGDDEDAEMKDCAANGEDAGTDGVATGSTKNATNGV